MYTLQCKPSRSTVYAEREGYYEVVGSIVTVSRLYSDKSASAERSVCL